MRAIRDFFGTHYKGIKTKGSFTQNFAIAFSGNVTAQILGVLFTPFLARIYGPEAYGVFALLMAVVSNMSQISTLQLPSGYVAAQNDREFFGIVKITFTVLFLVSGISTIGFLFFGRQLTAVFHASELYPYLMWIPVYLVLMGIDSILSGWNIRLKEFKRGAVSKVLSTVVSRGASLIIGLTTVPSAAGIIVGNLLVYPIEGVTKLSRAVRRTKMSDVFRSSPWHEWKHLLTKYREYILFVTPGVFITNFSNLLPVYCFSIAYSEKEVGHFALAASIVSLPLTLIVNSSTTVFLQKAAETINNSKEDLSRLVLSLYNKLFFVGFVPLVLLAFTGRWIFAIVFGPVWEQSGVFVSFLCVAFSFNVVFGPLSVLFRLLKNEKTNFITTIVFFGIRFLGLWIGVLYNDVLISIIGFCAASLLSQVTSIVIIFRMVKLPMSPIVRNVIIVGLFGILVIWLSI